MITFLFLNFQAIDHFLGPGIVFEELRQYNLEDADWDALKIYSDVLKVSVVVNLSLLLHLRSSADLPLLH